MRTLSILVALVLAVAVPLRAAATTVLDVPVAQMAGKSAAIVRGVVEKQQVAWNEDHSLIVTRTRIRVTKALKGDVGFSVTLRQTGGTLDGVAMGPAGDAKFTPGEEVLVFLEPHPAEKGAWMLIAMGAAKFTLRATAEGLVAERDLEGLSFARRGVDGVIRPAPPESPARLSFDSLLREIAPVKP
jgi:hypothetical protein